MTDEIERLRAELQAAWNACEENDLAKRHAHALIDRLRGEIARLQRVCANKDANIGDLQQILIDERAHVEALETEIGEYRAEIERLRKCNDHWRQDANQWEQTAKVNADEIERLLAEIEQHGSQLRLGREQT